MPPAHLPEPFLTLASPWAGGQSWDLTLRTPLRAASPFLSLELSLGPASQQPGVLVLRLGPGGVPGAGLPSPTCLSWPLLGAVQPSVHWPKVSQAVWELSTQPAGPRVALSGHPEQAG